MSYGICQEMRVHWLLSPAHDFEIVSVRSFTWTGPQGNKTTRTYVNISKLFVFLFFVFNKKKWFVSTWNCEWSVHKKCQSIFFFLISVINFDLPWGTLTPNHYQSLSLLITKYSQQLLHMVLLSYVHYLLRFHPVRLNSCTVPFHWGALHS